MLTRIIDSPASVEPAVQALLREYHALNDRKQSKADRRADQARIIRELGRLGLSCN